MANYKAIVDGNWSDLATWEDDGTGSFVASTVLPGVSDDVYSNSHIVTILSNVSCNNFYKKIATNILRGGQFQIDGTLEITTQGDIYGADISQSGTATTLRSCVSRLSTHTNIWTHIGNITGGNVIYYASGCTNYSTYDVNLIGNQIAGISGFNYGFINYNGLLVNITGNQIGGGGTIKSTGVENVVADAEFNVTGNQIGGSGIIDSVGISNSESSVIFNITGNQIANSAYSVYNSGTNTNMIINGNAYGNSVAAIYNSQPTSVIIYEGNVYNELGVMAIHSPKLFLNVTPTTEWEFSDFGGTSQYLVAEIAVTGMPTEADVRKDTVYGPVSGLTGTLAVPPAATVNEGVPVDDTVGTGTNGLTTVIIDRLSKCATAEITASLLANMK